MKGSWNPDGKGFRPVPEEHKAFFEKKRRQFYQNVAECMLASGVVTVVFLMAARGGQQTVTVAQLQHMGVYLFIAGLVTVALGVAAT